MTVNELTNLIKESIIRQILESRNLIDNFDKICNLLEFNSDDDFYFVQIKKRWKDNDDAYAERDAGMASGIYHGGAWHLKSWRIHSAKELMQLKPEIVKWCEDNNARAYITVNTRSTKDTDSYVKVYQSKYSKDDARYKHADEIVPGQAKTGDKDVFWDHRESVTEILQSILVKANLLSQTVDEDSY